jgi:hypothetical protein
MTEPTCRHRLEGLEPDNLLAFLALLGLLRALEAARPAWRPRAGWDVDTAPLRPFLELREPVDGTALCEAAADGVASLASSHDFGSATDIKMDSKVGRAIGISACERAEAGQRHFADLCAALFSDAATNEDGSRLEPTPLAYPSVATSNFLRSLKTTSQAVMPEKRSGDQSYPKNPATCIWQALFASWHRLDRPVGLRWDPDEAKRHAYQWRAPTKDPPMTQHGANRLAIAGLAVLTAAPITTGGRAVLAVLGGRGTGDSFSFAWPIWRESASLASIKALLSHPRIREVDAMAHYSVDHVRLTRRFSLDRLRSFTLAAPVAEE